jgi:hypothetical protein
MLNHIEETQSLLNLVSRQKKSSRAPIFKKTRSAAASMMMINDTSKSSKSKEEKYRAVTWQISDFKNEHFVSLLSKSEDAIYIFIYLFGLQ